MPDWVFDVVLDLDTDQELRDVAAGGKGKVLTVDQAQRLLGCPRADRYDTGWEGVNATAA